MFLNCIVTGDEIWVHYAKAETKPQSKQWERAGSPPPKKFKLSPSAGKVMLIAFWDSHGIILAYFMSDGQSVTARYYSEEILKTIQRKTENVVCQASPEKCPSFA